MQAERLSKNAKVGLVAVIYQGIHPCNQLGNELACWLIGQADIQTGIGKL